MKILALASMALVLVGAGCAQTKTDAPVTQTEKQAPVSAPTAQAPEPIFKNLIEVKDQKPGDEAMIDAVSIEKKGYIVVHEDNDGKVGKIVGHSDLLNAGETKSVTFKMKIHAGLSHWAMLHIDNGDGVFDEKQDLPLKDENGEFIMKSFMGEGEAMKQETATSTNKME